MSDIEHGERHDREERIERDNVQRLEREVVETAQRIEIAVDKALTAVRATDEVHHEAHTHMHEMEQAQLRRSGIEQQRAADALAASLAQYKSDANEWRATLRDQTTLYLRKDEAAVTIKALEDGRRANAEAIVALRETVLTTFSKQGGKSEGISDTAKAAYLAVSAVSIILAVVATIIAFTR